MCVGLFVVSGATRQPPMHTNWTRVYVLIAGLLCIPCTYTTGSACVFLPVSGLVLVSGDSKSNGWTDSSERNLKVKCHTMDWAASQRKRMRKCIFVVGSSAISHGTALCRRSMCPNHVMHCFVRMCPFGICMWIELHFYCPGGDTLRHCVRYQSVKHTMKLPYIFFSLFSWLGDKNWNGICM